MKQAQFYFLLLFIIISSCKTSTKKEEFAELLSNPPYTELTDSITKFPGNDQLFINRGILLTKQGQFAAAVNDFEKAWTLKQTEDAAVFYAAGLINSKKYDNAISHLKTATGKFPQNLVLMERLGYAFEQKNDYLSASKVYEGILRIDSTDFRTWAARAFCYQELNNDEEAIRSFEKSYQLEPNQSVGIELASMYAETKNPKTIAFCDGIIKADTATVKNIQPFYCKRRY
jgi:tetratricopeptide (TPR) repeat protein